MSTVKLVITTENSEIQLFFKMDRPVEETISEIRANHGLDQIELEAIERQLREKLSEILIQQTRREKSFRDSFKPAINKNSVQIALNTRSRKQFKSVFEELHLNSKKELKNSKARLNECKAVLKCSRSNSNRTARNKFKSAHPTDGINPKSSSSKTRSKSELLKSLNKVISKSPSIKAPSYCITNEFYLNSLVERNYIRSKIQCEFEQDLKPARTDGFQILPSITPKKVLFLRKTSIGKSSPNSKNSRYVEKTMNLKNRKKKRFPYSPLRKQDKKKPYSVTKPLKPTKSNVNMIESSRSINILKEPKGFVSNAVSNEFKDSVENSFKAVKSKTSDFLFKQVNLTFSAFKSLHSTKNVPKSSFKSALIRTKRTAFAENYKQSNTNSWEHKDASKHVYTVCMLDSMSSKDLAVDYSLDMDKMKNDGLLNGRESCDIAFKQDICNTEKEGKISRTPLYKTYRNDPGYLVKDKPKGKQAVADTVPKKPPDFKYLQALSRTKHVISQKRLKRESSNMETDFVSRNSRISSSSPFFKKSTTSSKTRLNYLNQDSSNTAWKQGNDYYQISKSTKNIQSQGDNSSKRLLKSRSTKLYPELNETNKKTFRSDLRLLNRLIDKNLSKLEHLERVTQSRTSMTVAKIVNSLETVNESFLRDFFNRIKSQCRTLGDIEILNVNEDIKERILKPICLLLKERSLEFTQENFIHVGRDILNGIPSK